MSEKTIKFHFHGQRSEDDRTAKSMFEQIIPGHIFGTLYEIHRAPYQRMINPNTPTTLVMGTYGTFANPASQGDKPLPLDLARLEIHPPVNTRATSREKQKTVRGSVVTLDLTDGSSDKHPHPSPLITVRWQGATAYANASVYFVTPDTRQNQALLITAKNPTEQSPYQLIRRDEVIQDGLINHPIAVETQCALGPLRILSVGPGLRENTVAAIIQNPQTGDRGMLVFPTRISVDLRPVVDDS